MTTREESGVRVAWSACETHGPERFIRFSSQQQIVIIIIRVSVKTKRGQGVERCGKDTSDTSEEKEGSDKW